MIFKVVTDSDDLIPTKDLTIYLIRDEWNDWWKYKTLFSTYLSIDGQVDWLGSTKIGNINMRYESEILTIELPNQFEKLDSEFFSLGQDTSFYSNLLMKSDDIRENVLDALNDIAFKQYLYESYKYLNITQVSILRGVSNASVTGQFKRLANGESKLTEFKFQYKLPRPSLKGFEMELYTDPILNINVTPNTHPSTNLHVVVGRNGVGKTFLMKNLVTCLLTSERGKITYDLDSVGENLFANVISVSFSGFDNSYYHFHETNEDAEFNINYFEIGLMKKVDFKLEINEDDQKNPIENQNIIKDEVQEEIRSPKTVEDMCKEFQNSLKRLSKSGKASRWKKMIRILNTDPVFEKIGIQYLIEKKYYNKTEKMFENLSSGHMYVLLTITKLVEYVEERSIVILDEPEMHLHPPLIASFIRAISELLVNRNAVGIVATHTPVVVQEVSADCVNIIERQGKLISILKPRIETYGENVGTLTREIFRLEINNSGYNYHLKKAVEKFDTYEEVLDHFNHKLGAEARTVIRSLMLYKNEDLNNEES